MNAALGRAGVVLAFVASVSAMVTLTVALVRRRHDRLRLAVPYDDPKAFDDTPAEAEKYDERSQQIAREMLYIFFKAREQLQ